MYYCGMLEKCTWIYIYKPLFKSLYLWIYEADYQSQLNHRMVIVSLSLVKVIDGTVGRFVAEEKVHNFQAFEFMNLWRKLEWTNLTGLVGSISCGRLLGILSVSSLYIFAPGLLFTKSFQLSFPPTMHLSLERVCVLSCFSRVWLLVTPWTVATRLLCPWDSPGRNTGVGWHALPQGILPTQGSNPCLLH